MAAVPRGIGGLLIWNLLNRVPISLWRTLA